MNAHAKAESYKTKLLRGLLKDFLPNLFAILLFFGGLILLFSAFTPAVKERFNILKLIIPMPLVEFSHQFAIVTGVLMLFIARSLSMRIDSAYYATLSLLLFGIIAAILKGFDYEEAIILSLLFVAILPFKRLFYRKSALLSNNFNIKFMILIALALGVMVYIGFYSYQHIPYSDELWFDFEEHPQAGRFLRSLPIMGALVSIIFLHRIMTRGADGIEKPTQEEMEKVGEIIRTSDDSEAALATLGDKFFIFGKEQKSFIMYAVRNQIWIAMGDPIGDVSEFADLVWKFREQADLHAAKVAFFQVSEKYLPLYLDMGLSLSKLGEEACIDTENFSLTGKKMQGLRTSLNRHKRENIEFSVVKRENVPEILKELRAVSDNWLTSKEATEKHFSLGNFNEQYISQFDIAIAKFEGKITAFTNIWQTENKEEFSIDLMRYRNDASHGIMEYLFTSLILWGHDNGFKTFRLGLSPLSGLENHPLAPVWHRVGNSIFHLGNDFYNFEGLHNFKDKFNPIWRPRYLAASSGLGSAAALLAATRLVNGGILDFS